MLYANTVRPVLHAADHARPLFNVVVDDDDDDSNKNIFVFKRNIAYCTSVIVILRLRKLYRCRIIISKTTTTCFNIVIPFSGCKYNF
jgi:hypothetical protein